MLYSLNNQYPTELPNRIRLSNGLTRTNPNTFTPEEIADAGYIPITIPEYNPELEQLVWTGTEFLVELIPPPLPQPNWDNFNTQMMTNARFNQVYNQCLQVAPIVANSLPTALDQITSKPSLSLFTIIWTQLCQIGGATAEDKQVWGNYATENNLSQEFINILIQ